MKFQCKEGWLQMEFVWRNGPAHGRYDWIVLLLDGEAGGKSFQRSGSWLTTNEASDLVAFLRSVGRSAKKRSLTFVEPNLRFETDASGCRVAVFLDLEPKPRRTDADLPSRMSFHCTPAQAVEMAREIESAMLAAVRY